MDMRQSGGRRLDSDVQQLHRRVRPLRGSWGSRQLSSTEHVYPSPRVSTDLSTTLSSHDLGCNDVFTTTTTAGAPCTPAASATPPGTCTPAPAHVEPSPVEFATPLSHDEERIDACYDGEPLWYRTMEDILDDQPVPGLVPHDLDEQLHLACDDGEPRSFAEAEIDAIWRAVMKTEMDAVEKNRSWELADLPHGHRVITLNWMFKLKRDEVDAIIKHKTRLVARGFLQREGIDFDDAFAPMAQMESA
jgi:hypothetical protein